MGTATFLLAYGYRDHSDDGGAANFVVVHGSSREQVEAQLDSYRDYDRYIGKMDRVIHRESDGDDNN